VEVGVGETEGFEHGCGVWRIGDVSCLWKRLSWLGATGSLPEGGFGVDVGEERAGDEGEETVEVAICGLRGGARGDFYFGDGEVGDCCFGEWPEERVILRGGGEPLSGGGETASHAKGEAEVDGKWETGSSAKQGAGDWVEDCRVDEAFPRTKLVVCDGEVVGEGGLGQGADGFGLQRLAFGTEKKTACGVVLLREFIGVEIVGCGENPWGGGDGCGSVRDDTKGAARGELRRSIRGGDQNGVIRKSEGEIREGGFEGFLREGNEAYEQAAGCCRCRRRGRGVGG